MITLTLLHPRQSTPVQSWTFESESAVHVGRASDNNVILYSAVVSRHHLELRKVDSHWKFTNLGANGTYVDGKSVGQMPVCDGMILRLGESGPRLRIRLGNVNSEGLGRIVTEQQSSRNTPLDLSSSKDTFFRNPSP
ncbi:FHA domain-containing protein [Lusitaniella coriacea LEGE 07157]|uniref:FHA domain-containing protein n=1 Tax=Lusitaniella coriacea LEGE 07157 TaxID=945747 RepID=A0A8J7JCL6_9CYAN|nr:FHA domain-containing protein [Lusitaniella coriacea]MBE9117525.1 FHA domain-containing protein [Lusitaniella coriacea LEGE 07157]